MKAQLDARRAFSLVDRLEIRATRYHRSNDQMGRAWITFDKREVVDFCDHRFDVEIYPLAHDIRTVSDSDARDAHDQARAILSGQGHFARWHFIAACERFLGLSIEAALQSEDPLIRALAVIDRRLGKRRLVSLARGAKFENPIMRTLLELRCEVEGIAGPVVA